MSRASYLLVLLSLVTSNIYMANSYTLTASVLNQFGYNNQSTFINLHNNDIDSIDPSAFNGYDKLTILDIFTNNLTAIDVEVFKGAVNIKGLYIQCRSLNKLTNSKNIKLQSLTELFLSNNLTSLNKPMFNAFPSLTSFRAGYDGEIKTIDVHTFESISNLTFLYLGFNLLTGFEYLQIPKNLRTLNLAGNKMNYFALSRTMGVLEALNIRENRFRSFKSMDFTFLANLTNIELSHNPHAYPYEIAGHLKHLVKLRHVELANLSISSIDSNYFKNNTNLQHIDLSLNKISSLDNRTFNGLNDLENILLSNNNLTKISLGTFINPYLVRLGLNGNQISEIDESSIRGSYNTEVYLDYNKLTNIVPRTFYNTFLILSLSYNQITEIKNVTFDGVSKIQTLDLSNNKIEKIGPGSFNNLVLGYLDLSFNNLTELKNESLAGQISFLNLRSNKIEKIEEGAFNYATITDTILLSYNSLTEINAKMFAGQNQLHTIELEKNKLSKIEPGAFANLPNLVSVNLQNNQLTQLDSSMFAGSNNLQTIFVAGNLNLSTANLQSLCPPAATNCHVFYE